MVFVDNLADIYVIRVTRVVDTIFVSGDSNMRPIKTKLKTKKSIRKISVKYKHRELFCTEYYDYSTECKAMILIKISQS